MNDKDLKKLKRDDLIEIIYQLQKNEKSLERELSSLQLRLENRRIAIENAGSIAEASLALNSVFEAVQKAADEYLDNIKLLYERASAKTETDRMPAKPQAGFYNAGESAEANAQTNKKAEALISNAKNEAAEIIVKAKAEAGAIVKRANLYADNIMNEANAHAEAIMAEAKPDVYSGASNAADFKLKARRHQTRK